MENKGFIKMYRDIWQESWAKNSCTVHLFFWLATNANIEDNECEGLKIQRGQLLTSIRSLSKQTGISEQSVRTALKQLCLTHHITQGVTQWVTQGLTHPLTHSGTLVTICDYDRYSGFFNEPNTLSNTPSNTGSNTPSNTQPNNDIRNNKEYKEENKEIVIEDKSSLSVSTDEQPTTDTKKKSKASKVPSTISVGDKQIVTDELLRYWNSAMEGRVISKLNQITEKRAKFIKIRLSNFTPEDLFKVIDKAAISDFLNGRVGTRGWIANFDWIFGNESNFIKVLEGRYDNVSSPSKPTQQSLFPSTSNNNSNNNNNGLIQNNYDTGTSGNAEYDSYLAGLRNAGVINENTERSYKQDYRLGKQSQANMQREREQRLANGETQIKDCPDLSELDIWMD